MVALYVGGRKVAWEDAEKVLAEQPGGAELRTDAGKVLGVIVPNITTRADDPDWVKAITPEEIERRMADEFLTFDQLKKRLGWE